MTSELNQFRDDPEAIKRILDFLKSEGIPLQHSVSMICKVKGIALGKLANECGYHRNQLYLSLTGSHRPSQQLRDGVAKQLGVDPWNYTHVEGICA
tara:strand:+ start:105 stop:392 length:288 start_codon:yes stop_codon:yes gene_type:complete